MSCVFPNNTEYCTANEVARITVGCVSVLSTLFILFLIFLFRRYNFLSQRLILYLVIAAFFDSVAYSLGAVGGQEEGPLCTLAGFYLSVTDWAVVVWVCNITVNLFWNVVVLRPSNLYLEVFYVVVSVVVPVFFSLFPFIDSSYGPAGLWCWINNDREAGKYLRFFVWYIPIWLVTVGLFVMFLIIIVKLTWEVRRWDPYNPESQRKRDLIRREIKPLILYPFAFLLLNIFPTINRIQNAIEPDNPIFALYLLHAFTSPLLGFGCTIIFVVNRETLSELKWSSFKQTLLTRFKSRGEVVEMDVSNEKPNMEHSVEISKTNTYQEYPRH